MTTGGSCVALQRGNILLVPFPFSDLSTTKVRPAAVVSGPLYHGTEPDTSFWRRSPRGWSWLPVLSTMS